MMPIKQITDSNTLSVVKRGVPIVGDFRKGEEKDSKGRWGKDLEDGSWRVTFREGYEMFEDAFNQIFADTREPFIIATIDATPDDVFNDYYRLYGGNGLAQIVCDGEHIEFSADKKLTACMDCPAKRENAKSAKEKATYCAPNAYFRFTIPKFNRAMQMPVPFLFQFNVTSVTELQHIKKELLVAYEQKGTLINELFLLYRNNRRFNRGGVANDKSLAYVLWLDKNLDEKAQDAQLRLESGDIQVDSPQFPAGDDNRDSDFVSATDPVISDDRLNQISDFLEKAVSRSLRQLVDSMSVVAPGTFNYSSINQHTYEEISFNLLENMAVSSFPFRVNSIGYDKRENRYTIPFLNETVLMFSRKQFRKALQKAGMNGEAIANFVNRFDKKPIQFMKDLQLSLEDLPLFYVGQKIDPESGEHGYFYVESITIPDTLVNPETGDLHDVPF